jgi:hypothetical protein
MAEPCIVWIEDAFGEWRRHEVLHSVRHAMLMDSRPEDQWVINGVLPYEFFLRYPQPEEPADA